MPGRFQYQARSDDAWKQRGEQSSSKFAGFILDEYDTYSPKKGANWGRIMPPTWQDANHYGIDIWVHYGVGPDRGSVLCLRKMASQACPMCESAEVAEKAGREDASDFKPTRRVLVWWLDRQPDKDAKSPLYPWAMPWTIDRDISKLCRDRQTGELYQVDHPDSGFDISFEKEGEQLTTKYVGIQIARRPTPVPDEFLQYILEHPLPNVLQWRTYEEIVALFEGQAPVAESKPATTAAPAFESRVTSTAPPASRTQMFAPQVTAPAPPVTNPYCYHQIKIRGELFACGLAPGHQGDHDYVIGIGPEPAALVTPQFCQNMVTIRGEKLGCTFEAGHQGDCNYDRPVNGAAAPPVFNAPPATTPTPPQMAAPLAAPVRTAEPAPLFAPRPVAAAPAQPPAQPVAPQPAASPAQPSRAAALRARFQTGPK